MPFVEDLRLLSRIIPVPDYSRPDLQSSLRLLNEIHTFAPPMHADIVIMKRLALSTVSMASPVE